MTLERSRIRVLGSVLLAALVVACAPGEKLDTAQQSREPAASSAASLAAVPKERPAGHQRMLHELELIRQRTPDENMFQGDRGLRFARQVLDQLPQGAEPPERWRALTGLANEEIKQGLERAAIDHFEAAYALMPELAESVSSEEAVRAIFRTGIAWLRFGETQNCAVQHNAESCILPIRGAGVHTDQEGSRNAILYFEQVLAASPNDHPVSLKAVWLLNVAYMTLGQYPRGVPEPYRIPEEVFGSGEDFPRFINRAPDLGVATQNLFGGVVVDDFTGDGYLDILTTTFDAAGQAQFFRNEGGLDFSNQTASAGIDGLYGGLNVVQADYDNDGDLDAFILRGAWLSGGGRHPNSLLSNDGEGHFTDVTFDAGLGDAHYPTQTAAWADYDNDGDVDLYIGNEDGEQHFDGPCQLFRNNGDGTFTDVAASAGVDHRGFVKGVIWGDTNGDRFADLYVSTMQGKNLLYRNNRDGTFTDVAAELGVAGPVDSFPVWFWDYDNDGQLDLYVPSYKGETDALAAVAASYFGAEIPFEMPHLYRGIGNGGFENVASKVGLDLFLLPMGANFGDIDNDGYLDFYLGTGYPDYEAVTPNVMYRNLAGSLFSDVTLEGGFGHLQKGHSIAFADFDNDGDQDLFAQMGGAYPGDRASDALYENPGFGNRWLTLDLVGVKSNRSAIGVRIRVDVTEEGKRRSIYKHVNSGGSFGSNPLRQILGLGNASRIDQLEIYWPTSDLTQSFSSAVLDQHYRIIEGGDALSLVEQTPNG